MNTKNETSPVDRIRSVVSYLTDHLEQTPSLDDLARVAGVSPFHFHRLYRAVTGETPLGTVRRLRLLRAAVMLRDTDQAITAIAFASGYESSQAFAKAFRLVAGDSPTILRRDESRLEQVIQDLTSPPTTPAPTPYEIKVVEVEPFTVIASRCEGRPEDFFHAYGALFGWAQEAGISDQMRGIYGVPIDDPRSVPEGPIRFDCCFDFGPSANPEGSYRKLTLGGGQYAVVRHRGPYEGLEEKYDYLYGTWLGDSGCTLRNGYPHHRYLNDPDTLPPEQWETDIFLPVA